MFDGTARDHSDTGPGTNATLGGLRVGLLVDSLTQPLWRARMIADLASRPDEARLALVILARPRGDRPSGARTLLGRLYAAADGRLFGGGSDPMEAVREAVSLAGLVAGCPTVEVGGCGGTGPGSLTREQAGEIRGHRLDVVICLGAEPLPEEARGLARLGVWSFRLDGRRDDGGMDVGVREVLSGRATTVASLHDLADPGLRPLAVAHIKADRRSARRHRDHVRVTSSSLLRCAWGSRAAGSPDAAPLEAESAPAIGSGYPDNREMAALLARFAARSAGYLWGRLLGREQWFLACVVRDEGGAPCADLAGLRPTFPPSDRYWADPFPAVVNGRRFVFVEEVVYREGKGRIAVLELDGSGRVTSSRTAIERDCHLSYPFLFRHEGHFFMVPETSADRSVELYRCVDFPYRWERERVLLEGLHAVDATLVERGGRWWMFANVAAEGAIYDFEELHLFHAPSPSGPWRPHPRNPLKCDARSARPAGRPFFRGGHWFRPAQDCSIRYGGAIALNRIVRWDLEGYEEVEASRIEPDWAPGLLATHTINACAGLTVLDGLRRRPRLAVGRGMDS